VQRIGEHALHGLPTDPAHGAALAEGSKHDVADGELLHRAVAVRGGDPRAGEETGGKGAAGFHNHRSAKHGQRLICEIKIG